MDEMTPRERFLATMRFKKPDRLPLFELWIPDHTILTWIDEGMPLRGILSQREILTNPEDLLPKPVYYADPTKYFGLDRVENLTIDFSPLPRFVYRILEEDDRHRIIIDQIGTKKKIFKAQTWGMPQFLERQVKSEEDWDKIKARFNPADPRRYPPDWGDELIQHYEGMDCPLSVWMPGFFAMGRQLVGTIPFVAAFYRDPELVRDMINFWTEFLIETSRRAVETLKSRIDYVVIHEDMSYKHGPHVSPKLFREFMLPSYKRVTDFLKRNGIDIIFVDSDGNIRPLIPLLLEGGINGLLPNEVVAGMDAAALRREYGRHLLLIGNIDKRAVAEGKDAIEREVESKLPYLRGEGGYIPSLDHEVSPDIPYENYVHYINFIKRLL